MFKSDSESRAAGERLWRTFGDKSRGETITWSNLEAVMGRTRIEPGGWHIIRRFRKRLLRERRIVTLPADTVGLRLLTHQETAREVPALRQRRAYRQINRCLKETATVDGTGLTDHERKVLAVQRHNLAFQRLQIGRSRRQLVQGTKKTEVNPLRKEKAAELVGA